jgi:predicted nucleotidyltransferase
MPPQAIVDFLRDRLPGVMAVHAFGSRIHGTARADSDFDVAVLVAGYADPVRLFDVAGELSDRVGCPVDLVDLRAASTVMQHQILTRGERWWARDPEAALFEAAALSEKNELDVARAGLMADVGKRGTVYGR